MNKTTRIIIIIAVVTVAALAFVAKQNRPAATNATFSTTTTATKLPRLVDLGATKCIPCKLMAPVLEDLKKEYAGRMNVEFIDVWENPDAGKPYSIEIIPTQIFFNAEGKELFRHVGFFAKEDILAKWKELGVDLAAKPAAGK
jgi:thioredoxin 1